MRTLAAVVMIVLGTVAQAGDVAECAVFVLPSKPESSALPVAVTIDGKAPEGIWRKYLQRHFAFFDRNDDEQLDEAEFKKMLPLPAEKTADLKTSDGDGDGKLSQTEFVASAKLTFPHFAAWATKPDRRDAHLAEIFAKAIDPDQDGKFGRTTYPSLSRALRPYDHNDDECLELKEFRASFTASVKPIPPKSVALFYSPVAFQLDLGAKPTASINKDRLVQRDAGAASRLVASDARGEWILFSALRQEIPDVKSSADFLLAQHAEAIGGNESLTRDEVTGNPALGAIGELFPFADRNDDNQLTAAELRAYLDLIREGVAAQVTITLRDHGGNLFPLLDLDGDQKLMPAELARVRELFEGESNPLPTVLQLEIGSVSLPAWGGVRLPAAKPKKMSAAKESVPAWFTAQDRNEDGRLSEREFFGPPEVFRKYDADRDGLLAPSETQEK